MIFSKYIWLVKNKLNKKIYYLKKKNKNWFEVLKLWDIFNYLKFSQYNILFFCLYIDNLFFVILN